MALFLYIWLLVLGVRFSGSFILVFIKAGSFMRTYVDS